MAKKLNANITVEEVRNILEEEVYSMDWGGRLIDLDGRPPLWASISFMFDGGVLGFAYSDSPKVDFYPHKISEALSENQALAALLLPNWFGKVLRFINRICGYPCERDGLIRETIKHIIKHENRHAQQYDFLRAHGLDPNEITLKENENKSYENRSFEKDAEDFANGKINDMSIVFAQYLK